MAGGREISHPPSHHHHTPPSLLVYRTVRGLAESGKSLFRLRKPTQILDVSTSNGWREAGDGSDVVYTKTPQASARRLVSTTRARKDDGRDTPEKCSQLRKARSSRDGGMGKMKDPSTRDPIRASVEGFRGFEVMFDSLLDGMGISSGGLVYVIEKPPKSE